MAENKGILPSSTFNTLGNNSNKWEAVYAKKIVGPLTGNVSGSSSSCTGNSATATKATQDSAGQQINTTYIKGLSASNATLTYTKGNGTTGTVTVNNVATATNADKLDGYHYTDIINNAKASVSSGVMGAPNWAGRVSISGKKYTVPSNGFIVKTGDRGLFVDIINTNYINVSNIIYMIPMKKGNVVDVNSANMFFIPCS